MNRIASIIGESVAATLVFIVCFSVPEILTLPLWTVPLFGVPAVFYLDWRLGEVRRASWKIVLWAAGVSLLLFLLTRFAPSGDGWLVALFLILVFMPASRLSWWQRRNGGSQ